MLSADVSWRCEPGINRAYVWLSDGTVVGYRDLDTSVDYPSDPANGGLMNAVLAEWIASTGVPCATAPQAPITPDTSGRGLRAWFRNRRLQRAYENDLGEFQRWRLDHPVWKVPTDPPHGGWRDLVRNDPGEALWRHAGQLPAPSSYNLGAWRDARAWRVGAMGEETVASELWRLTRNADWRFLHSVPVGSRGSDIDHVLVGPGGVFTVNTKSHRDSNIWVGPNTLMVGGHKQPYLRNSRHEAHRAAKLLSDAVGSDVAVHPLIVIVDPRNISYRNPPEDVTVVTRHGLARWASGLPAVLNEDRISAIFSAARRSSTWIQA